MARPQLPALTGLRFVAALQVLLYHLFPYRSGSPRWVESLVGTGYVGVSLFFVLSGFILTYNYEDAVRAGTVRWREFWWARLARIYPVYLLGLLIAIPPYFLLSDRTASQVAARIGPSVGTGLFAVQAWGARTACVVNCPGWSISVESFFYLFFPLAALALAGLGRRRLLGVGAGAWALLLLFPLLYLALNPDGLRVVDSHSNAMWLTRLKFNPLMRVGEFVMGMAAGSLFLRQPIRVGRWTDLLAAGLIVAVLAAAPLIPYALLHNGLLAPAFALLIVSLAAGGGPVAALLSRRGWATLGGASYALYIIHVPVGNWVLVGYHWAGATAGPVSHFALSTVATLAGALLVFHRVEEPARRWLRGLPDRLRARRPWARPIEELAAE